MSVPRDWIIRGRIPPDAADQIRRAIEGEDPHDMPQRFIFKDWDALDPAVLSAEEAKWKAFVEVFPKEVTDGN